MRKKDFIRIINEEINDFDFLSNELYLKEQENIEILKNPEFQKQFIVDSITKMRDKIKFDDFSAHISNDPDLYSDQHHDDMNLEVDVELQYLYGTAKEPIKFSLFFAGDKIGYHTGYEYERGDYWTPSSGEAWYNSISWSDIDVNLYTPEGDEIKFIAFEKAPDNIQELFIRSYVEDAIKNKTDIEQIREKLPQYTSF